MILAIYLFNLVYVFNNKSNFLFLFSFSFFFFFFSFFLFLFFSFSLFFLCSIFVDFKTKQNITNKTKKSDYILSLELSFKIRPDKTTDISQQTQESRYILLTHLFPGFYTFGGEIDTHKLLSQLYNPNSQEADQPIKLIPKLVFWFLINSLSNNKRRSKEEVKKKIKKGKNQFRNKFNGLVCFLGIWIVKLR